MIDLDLLSSTGRADSLSRATWISLMVSMIGPQETFLGRVTAAFEVEGLPRVVSLVSHRGPFMADLPRSPIPLVALPLAATSLIDQAFAIPEPSRGLPPAWRFSMPPPRGIALSATARPSALDLYTALCLACRDDAFSNICPPGGPPMAWHPEPLRLNPDTLRSAALISR